MSLLKRIVNHAITGGDHGFKSEFISAPNLTIQAIYSNIVVADVQMYLAVSPDGIAFDIVQGSLVNLDPSVSSHSWICSGVTPNSHIKVLIKNCAGKAGTINTINYNL